MKSHNPLSITRLCFLFLLITGPLCAQHHSWTRFVARTGSADGLEQFFEAYNDTSVFSAGSLLYNDSLYSLLTYVLFDTSGLIRKRYDYSGHDTSNSRPIYRDQNYNWVGFYTRGGFMQPVHERRVTYGLDLIPRRKTYFNSIEYTELFGDQRSFFRFRNKYILSVGRRGDYNSATTIKNYWMKMDTAHNIIDQHDHYYATYDMPMTACWSSSGKIKSISHGVYLGDNNRLSYSTFETDTAGNFSPKTKHIFPGICREPVTNTGYPSYMRISELPSKDFVVCAPYNRNNLDTVLTVFAVFDSTLTTIKKFKKVYCRFYSALIPLKNGNFAALEEEYADSPLNSKTRTWFNFKVLDSSFSAIYSYKIKYNQKNKTTGMTSINGRDILFTHRSRDSVFFTRINNVGEPYVVEPYPPDSSFYTFIEKKNPGHNTPIPFPNPGNDLVKFLNISNPFRVSFYDLVGRKVIDSEFGGGIQTHALQPGLYTYKIWHDGKVWIGKWVKE